MTGLERFVTRLLASLEARHPAGARRPFTVAELRDTILPYRMHRAALALSSSEDYELLVLRLLAEEGGFAQVTPPESAERAREEVASPVPDLDLVELLDDATLQLTPGLKGRLALAESAQLTEAPEIESPPAQEIAVAEGSVPDDAPTSLPGAEDLTIGPAEDVDPDDLDLQLEEDGEPEREAEALIEDVEETPRNASGPFEPLADSVTVDGVSASASAELLCRGCEAALPADRPVAFCPHCGEQVGVRRCRRCGSEMEPEWRYCGACGEAHVR